MKRKSLLLISLCMLGTLSACGGKNDSETLGIQDIDWGTGQKEAAMEERQSEAREEVQTEDTLDSADKR